MKKPDPKRFGLNANGTADGAYPEFEAYAEACKRYEEYKAAKKLKNREYRKARTEREQRLANEAKAMKANRDIDPTREEWLMRAAKAVLAHVAELGFTPTGEVRVALGVPPKTGRKNKALGVCYHSTASEAAYREIFIHPELTDSRKLLGVLVHEIGHAVLKDGVGHRAPFKKFCQAVGFEFTKAEYADDGEPFWAWASKIAAEIGPIPHRRLNCDHAEGGKKKQSTRMLKIECPCCGIKLRTAKATFEKVLENSTSLRCIDPTCEGEVDIEELLNDISGDDEA